MEEKRKEKAGSRRKVPSREHKQHLSHVPKSQKNRGQDFSIRVRRKTSTKTTLPKVDPWLTEERGRDGSAIAA